MRTAALSVLLLLAFSADAEEIRVAVARGPALTVEGARLVTREAAEGAAVELGRAASLRAAGGLVHDGTAGRPRLLIEDSAGTPLRLGGKVLLGQLEVIAKEGSLLAVEVLDIERYVASVIGAEMPAAWPAAALEAQAIAARTYVLKKKLEGVRNADFHVEATVLHQAYGGAASTDPRTVAAAEATRGKVLVQRRELIDAFFFSSCRGTTEEGESGLGRAADYLVPVPCRGAEANPNLEWTRRHPLEALDKKLRGAGAIGDRLAGLEVSERTGTGRVSRVRLVTKHGARTVGGAEFRRLLGWKELPSLDFEIARDGADVVLRGWGAGHGVGLCQWCAYGMAREGGDAEAILRHFYGTAELRRMY